jgi:NADH-quinone oxidoreductase subunit G
VRFTAEIAGMQELGTTGRGERSEIGTWVEKSVTHELSGNIIDLCPVGALNSKPFRYQGRSWEMIEQPTVSPHDAVGTNLNAHVRRGELMRVVPRMAEEINENWISDRDRFSYEGIYAPDRLMQPLVRRDGALVEVDWQTALEAVAGGLQRVISSDGPNSVGILALPGATLEEHWLLSRLARGLGIPNLDHRLRRLDTRDQSADPLLPGLGMRLAEVDSLDAILVVGSDLRSEAPMLAHRVRKAAIKNRAAVAFVNPAQFPLLFPIAGYRAVGAAGMVAELGSLVRALADVTGQPVPDVAARAAQPGAEHVALAGRLAAAGDKRLVVLGGLAERHPAYSDIRALTAAIAGLLRGTLGYLTDGANAGGASLAGVLPHREAGGRTSAAVGLSAHAMLKQGLSAYILHGGVEPGLDTVDPGSSSSLSSARFVVSLSPYASEDVRRIATVILPIGTFAETSGTYVNAEGRWQSFTAVARLVGEARPGWKVLRVLGNLLDVPGFDYESSEMVRDELKALVAPIGDRLAQTGYEGNWAVTGAVDGHLSDVPMYQADPIVRRAPALQQTELAQRARFVY